MLLKYSNWSQLFESTDTSIPFIIVDLTPLANVSVSLPFIKQMVRATLEQSFPGTTLSDSTITIPNTKYESVDSTYEPITFNVLPVSTTLGMESAQLTPAKIIANFFKKNGKVINSTSSKYIVELDPTYLSLSEEEIKEKICSEIAQTFIDPILNSAEETIDNLMILRSLGEGFYNPTEAQDFSNSLGSAIYHDFLCKEILKLDLKKEVINPKSVAHAAEKQITELKQDYETLTDDEIMQYAQTAMSLIKKLYDYIQNRGEQISGFVLEPFSELMDYVESQPKLSAAIYRLKNTKK